MSKSSQIAGPQQKLSDIKPHKFLRVRSAGLACHPLGRAYEFQACALTVIAGILLETCFLLYVSGASRVRHRPA